MFTIGAFTLIDMLVAIVGFSLIGWVGRMVYDAYKEEDK
tara:strand:- start:261 stop:377 length:117 start_codon:yes stop_codon:yes gene_type:complete